MRDAGETRPLYAAVDLGTNNCRMLVAEPDGAGFRVVDSFSRIVRLGEGLRETGELGAAAVERTVAALRVCADRMAGHAVHRYRCVATEACRRAVNGHAFLDRVRRQTGLRLETIPAEEEARLTLEGCRSLLDPGRASALLFDIGGGSTELSLLDLDADGRARRRGFRSLPYGVVTLSEEFGADTVSLDTFEAMVARVDRDLDAFDADFDIAPRVAEETLQMLGTSGTMTTLGGLYLDLPRYDRSRVDGLTMQSEAVAALSARLAGQDFATRAAHPCIGPGRADLVVAGCAVVTALCRRWPVASLRVADRGLREGLLLGMMAGREPGRTPTPEPA